MNRNIEFVVRQSLCHGCGTCEAACPQDAVLMAYSEAQGIYLPHVDSIRCDGCGACVQACSGPELDLTARPYAEPDSRQHPLVGPHIGIHQAYTNNAERRKRAASGGIVTEIVDYLLTSGLIDGVVLTRMRSDSPLQAEGYIATSVEDLAASQKSKYCPVPLNRILKGLVRGEQRGRFAFVGLPHHVHGLRLLERLHPALGDSIPYVISLFTAHVPSQRATEFLLHENGIDADDVRALEYRGDGNPGRMKITTRDGADHFVPHLHWTYYGHAFPRFFYPVREWLYFDKLSEWADFSCGDNWMGGLGEQKGVSTVVTRSQHAEAIMQAMMAAQKITASPITAADLVADQDLENKLNIRERLLIWRMLGRTIPLYSRNFALLKGRMLRTFRFALYVLLCEHKIPYSLMSTLIRADYFLRALPGRALRRIIRQMLRVARIFRPYHPAAIVRRGDFKVVLIGGYGYRDIGDEAMPHAIRLALRKALGERLDLVMLSPDPESTERSHGETGRLDFTRISHSPGTSPLRKLAVAGMTAILLLAASLERIGLRLSLWRSAREALDEIGSADVILNVGGGNITTDIPSEFYKKCTTYLVARILGKPVFLSGQTMGPYAGWFARRYASACLNTVRMISFRDKEVSHRRLLDIGVTRPLMFDAADDAITLTGIDHAEAVCILQKVSGIPEGRRGNGLLVLLNIKGSLNVFKGAGRNSGLDREVSLMAQIADALVENFGCTIGFLATDFSAGVDDRVYHAAALERMNNRDGAFLVEDEYSDDELIGMIGCADIVVGSRYHFNVFAASRCVPFLGLASGIYQRTKLQGLADLCGLPQCYADMDMEFADFDHAWQCVSTVIRERESIRQELAKRIPVLKTSSLATVSAVASELMSRADRRHGITRQP